MNKTKFKIFSLKVKPSITHKQIITYGLMHQHNNFMLNQDKVNGQILFIYITCIQFTKLCSIYLTIY
jgi:hypothetical protein